MNNLKNDCLEEVSKIDGETGKSMGICLLSNRPWIHSEYLHMLCASTGCKVEAILCGEYVLYDHSTFWYDESIYEEVKKQFPKALLIHHDMKSWWEKAEEYSTKKNMLLIAELEYEEDCVFQFLEKHKENENIIPVTMYENNLNLCSIGRNVIVSEYVDHQLVFQKKRMTIISSRLKNK